MISFKDRAHIPEKMDDPGLPREELRLALRDIRKVNRFLGGHRVSREGLHRFGILGSSPPGHIVDVGCGDGEFLRTTARYFRKKGIHAELVGLDFNPKSIEMAQRASSGFPEIRYECCDIFKKPGLPPDSLVVCNLFLHHFSTAQVHSLIAGWLQEGVRGVIINDLHRNALAYYLFQLFGRIFMRSAIARYDGAVSIRRGFKKADMQGLRDSAGDADISIQWRWAFRWLCCIPTT